MPSDDNDINWTKVAGVGFEIAVGVGTGALIGTGVDHRFHTNPWGVVIGILVGCAAGMYLLIKEALKMNKD